MQVEPITTKKQLDFSLVEPAHSRISDLNKAANTNMIMQTSTPSDAKTTSEVIASRINANNSKSPDKYVVGNSLVVALNDSNVTAQSYQQSSTGKRSFPTSQNFRAGGGAQRTQQQSIFPSTTTATTANSYTEQREGGLRSKQQQQQQQQQQQMQNFVDGPPGTAMSQSP